MKSRNIYAILLLAFLVNCGTAKKAFSPGLQKELDEMVKTDQLAAFTPQGEYKKWPREDWNAFRDSIFLTHKIQVEKMFNKYGFLGFDKVGKTGSTHFWLIVQHCDKHPEFQKEVLTAMDKEVKKGNANPNDYAYLFDRVETNAGRKQMFGTQVTYDVEETGRAFPKVGLVDSVNVDQHRKQYKLGLLKDYLNQMTAMHFEMNKEVYEKKGITEPYLY